MRFSWPALFAPALWFLAGAGGAFPLNDDWAYASAVRRLVDEHRLRLSDWATPFDLPPIFSAALASSVFGFHHELLRLVTLAWGLAGLWLLDKWFREEGVSVYDRGLGIATLLFCPLYFVLLFSFHTEIPFLTLAFAALYAFRRADRETSNQWEIVGSVFVGLAFLTRETGIALLLGQTLWTALDRRLTPFRAIRIWLPALLLGGCGMFWFLAVHGPTWAFVNYLWGGTAKHLSTHGIVSATLLRASGAILTSALFALPLVPIPNTIILGAGLRPAPTRIKPRLVPALVIGGLSALFIRWNGGLPFFGNTWHPGGLGTLTGIAASEYKPILGVWSSPLTWSLLGVAAAAGAAFFLTAWRKMTSLRPARHALVVWVPLALATLPGDQFFDRYILMWLPLLLFPAVLGNFRRGRFARLIPLILLMVVSVAGTRDYFAWNRAKWSLGNKALSMGYRPEEIANGVDWAGWHYYDERMAALRQVKPLSAIGEMEWKQGPFPKVFITFDPILFPSSHLLAIERFRSPLTPPSTAQFLFLSTAKATSLRKR